MTIYVMLREVCLKHRNNRREILLRVRTQVPSWQRCLFFFVVCGAGVTTRAAHLRSSSKSRMPECQSGDAGAIRRASLAHGLRQVHQFAMSLFDQARQFEPKLSRRQAVVYILELRSGALYVGCSDDIEIRLAQHCSGTASRTTALDSPISVRFIETCSNFTAARRREAQIKRWSRLKKETLIAGDSARLRALSKSRD